MGVRSNLEAYHLYLLQAWNSGLPPDGRRWDRPCPWFVKAAEELIQRGWARRRWWLFGPIGITRQGIEALTRKA